MRSPLWTCSPVLLYRVVAEGPVSVAVRFLEGLVEPLALPVALLTCGGLVARLLRNPFFCSV
ncbi:MAG: hypothetical protein CMP23_05825 [Rickettsiales bacterium]|nr:hypothetical protein [Rickettsiales bacterium]